MGINGYGPTFSQRLTTAKQIIKESKDKKYMLQGTGQWSQYASFTMNYEYLTWWLGHAPARKEEPLRFVIQETPTTIILTKEMIHSKKK
jgi:hypothetical protein